MSKGLTKDPSIAIKPSQKIINFIKELDDESLALPENLLKLYQAYAKVSTKRKIYEKPIPSESLNLDEQKLLKTLHSDETLNKTLANCLESFSLNYSDIDDSTESDLSDNETKNGKNNARRRRAKQQKLRSKLTLNLTDLKWLNMYLIELRKSGKSVVYLHELLEGSKLVLPKNETIVRNPELEARCQRLKREQDERSYQSMTKNVDCSRTHAPDESISYQLKQINRQLIAVLQFIFSVLAGFAFGFIGVELIVGNLDFGFRLLLGIICALIIALAEIYFLAKKLNEDLDYAEIQETYLKARNVAGKANETSGAGDGNTTNKEHVE